MENKYKWAVEEIYSSIEDWNKDFEWVSNNLDFNEFKGKLGDSKTFLQCMKAQDLQEPKYQMLPMQYLTEPTV